jgi:Big-like domain-containing protein
LRRRSWNSARRWILAFLLLTLAAPHGAAQRSSRVATTRGALTAFPLFFHGKQIVIRSGTTSDGRVTRLTDTDKPVFVLWREREASRTDGEIRGDFWDLGRLQADDNRFTGVDFTPILEAATQGRWPARDQVFVIVGASFIDVPVPAAPGIRAIAMAPERFENRKVTLVGRFRGANLYADLPQGLGKSKWDFVIHSADAALWVSGIRPRGKDFELNPIARVDTSRWVEVSGTIMREGAQVWLAAESIKLATPPEEQPVEVTVAVPKEPAPRVIFTAPLQNDTEVERSMPIRIQFSRDMAGKSFADRVRVSYASGAQGVTLPAYTATYVDGNRALEIKFKQPLERFAGVKVELLEGIIAVDGQPLPPWTLTFTTGAT